MEIPASLGNWKQIYSTHLSLNCRLRSKHIVISTVPPASPFTDARICRSDEEKRLRFNWDGQRMQNAENQSHIHFPFVLNPLPDCRVMPHSTPHFSSQN